MRTLMAMTLLLPAAAAAQTDFYNLDHGRPLRVEDAYTAARWAFEIQGAPLDLSLDEEGVLRYTPSLELKFGVFPGVELSAGTALQTTRIGSESDTRLGGVEFSALANLWIEGRRLPAAGIRLLAHIPTEAEDSPHLEVRGILTRGLAGPVRVHLNGALVIGEDRRENGWAGIAFDYVLPFHHLLLLAEGTVTSEETESRVGSAVGLRLQATPTLVADLGLGREWQGEARRDWTVTLGLTREFGIRSLMPGGTR